MKIQDVPEFWLVNRAAQQAAMNDSRLHGYPIKNAEKLGLKIEERHVAVVCNDGQKHNVPLSLNFQFIIWGKSLKKGLIEVDGKRVPVVMLLGSSPKVKSALYFKVADFEHSEDLKRLKEEIQNKHESYQQQVIRDIQANLLQKLSETAKHAQRELPNLMDDPQKVFEWFKNHEFDLRAISAENFKSFIDRYNETGFIHTTFVVCSYKDKWGHTQGTSCEIDFEAKKVSLSIWSSDD